MLITMLKGRVNRVKQIEGPFRRVRRSMAIMDLSGPLPQAATNPKTVARPKAESNAAGASTRAVAPQARSTYGPAATEMSRLPRELDPFESDFPWIGWVEPRHESVVRSDRRSPTFEHDLQRVLAMFSN